MGVDAKLWFWIGALGNMGVLVALAWAGVAAVRRGDVRRHRALMLSSAALVGLFLLAYVAKVAVTGREDPAHWDPLSRSVLWLHEACIAVMLGGGSTAAFLAWRLRLVTLVSDPDHDPDPRRLRIHRRAGLLAVRAASLALLTAVAILLGMYLRG